MKLQCDAKELKKGLELIKPAVAMAKKTTIPEYETVRLSTNEGIKLMATDTEVALETQLDAEIEVSGSVNVSHKHLMAVLPTKGVVTLERCDKKLAVLSQEADYTLDAMDIADYPLMPSMRTRLTADIRYAVTKCLPFVSHEETQHFLSGVVLKALPTGLECAATDGRILKVVHIDKRKRKEYEMIIPTKAADIISRKFVDGRIKIGSKDNQAVFIQGDLKLATCLIDGVFPDYIPVISISDYCQITVDKASLKEKVQSVSKVLNLKKRLQRGVLFNTNGDGLHLSAKEEDRSAEAVIDAVFEGYGDEAVEFMVNPLLLYKCLDTIASPEITLSTDVNGRVGISGDAGDSTILMPMRYDKE